MHKWRMEVTAPNSTSKGLPKMALYAEEQSTTTKVQYLNAYLGTSPIVTGSFNCPMGIMASPENPYRVEVTELPLSTRTLATIMLAIWLSITRGSWWGKWTVLASSSENEMT